MLKYYKHLFTCFLSAGLDNCNAAPAAPEMSQEDKNKTSIDELITLALADGVSKEELGMLETVYENEKNKITQQSQIAIENFLNEVKSCLGLIENKKTLESGEYVSDINPILDDFNNKIKNSFEEVNIESELNDVEIETTYYVDKEKIKNFSYSGEKGINALKELNDDDKLLAIVNDLRQGAYTADKNLIQTRTELLSQFRQANGKNLGVWGDGEIANNGESSQHYEVFQDSMSDSSIDDTTETIYESLLDADKKPSHEDFLNMLGLDISQKYLTSIGLQLKDGALSALSQDGNVKFSAINFMKEYDKLTEVYNGKIDTREAKSTINSYLSKKQDAFTINEKGFSFDINAIKSGELVKGTLAGEESLMKVANESYEVKDDKLISMLSQIPDGVSPFPLGADKKLDGKFLVKNGNNISIMGELGGNELTLEDIIPDGYESEDAIRDVIIVALAAKVFGTPSVSVSLPSVSASLPSISGVSISTAFAAFTAGAGIVLWAKSDETAAAEVTRDRNVAADLLNELDSNIMVSEDRYNGIYELNSSYTSNTMDQRFDADGYLVKVYRSNDPEKGTIEYNDLDIQLVEVAIGFYGTLNVDHTVINHDGEMKLMRDLTPELQKSIENRLKGTSTNLENRSGEPEAATQETQQANTSTESVSQVNDSISHLSTSITDAVDFLKDHKVTGNFKTIELGVVDEGGDNIDVAVRKMPDNSYRVMIDPDGWANSESAKLSASEFSKPKVESTIANLIKKFRAQ